MKVFYLEEESKAHNQVRRWQKVFLSWREIIQMSNIYSYFSSVNYKMLKFSFTVSNTSDHETASG